MLGLLDFSPEIFSQIVHSLITDVGINKAWPLRSVCKTFAEYIMDDVLKNQPLGAFRVSICRCRVWRHRCVSSTLVPQILGSYLFCRTKKLLNVHRDLPLVLNRSIEYLLAFETTTTEVELGEKGDEYKMKVCNMLAYYDWRHVFRALYFGLEGPLQFDYSDGTHLYPTLSSDEQDLADKLAVATYFHNRHAISTIIRAGAKPWMASYTFGYPLSISAVRGNLHGTLNAILGNIPKLITKKTVDYSLILDMFYNTIAAVSAQEEYDAATYLTEWFSKRVSAQPKHAYDKLVYDAFHSQHLPYIAAALNLKVHTGLRKVNHHHLVEIIKNDDMPALKYIIRKGYMDVNRYWYSYSPLTPAVHLGSINAVRELLKAGANPDGSPARRTYQHSPLRIAVVNENLPMAKLLLQYGPDPNGIPSTCGIVLRSPLYIAVKKQNRSMVEMLLQNGARVNGHSGSISNDRKMIFRHAMKMETVRRIRTYETKTDTNSEARKNVFFIKKVVVPPYGSIYEAILRADEQEQAEAEQTIENEENLDVDVDLVNG